MNKRLAEIDKKLCAAQGRGRDDDIKNMRNLLRFLLESDEGTYNDVKVLTLLKSNRLLKSIKGAKILK